MTNSEEKRVLVVDDDDSIRQLLHTLVKREGIPVDAISDGLEAIEKLKVHRYSVILLDLMMPRLDGFGVIEFLRDNPPDPKPIVLVVTAYADQKFKEVDPNVVAGVLRKPFEVSEIGHIIRACVLEGDDVHQLLRRTRSRSGSASVGGPSAVEGAPENHEH